MLLDFIQQHKVVYGVESICRVLPIAPSTYYRHARRLKQPDLRAKRCVSDERLLAQIHQIWEDSLQVYGYRKVWHQLQRQGVHPVCQPKHEPTDFEITYKSGCLGERNAKANHSS